MRPRDESTLARLHETYCTQPQIGLVLGAGVTICSGVPGYLPLALQVYRLALERQLIPASPQVREYLTYDAVAREATEAEEIFEHLRAAFPHRPDVLYGLVREALYDNRFPFRVKKTVPPRTYLDNQTLDAVISFCAAPPGASHAAVHVSKRVAANKRVGAILTTNYDNLVEGAFGTKYGKQNLLRPVGRFPDDSTPGTIPAYHCHGYISYARAEDEGVNLLIAEHDYFDAFYDESGFGNVVATTFFRRWPSLFIGSSMADRNIRRVLHKTRDEAAEHFAILKCSGPKDDLVDEVLRAYGVSVIRIDDYSEIPTILGDLYLAPIDVGPNEWGRVRSPQRRWSLAATA